MTLAGHRASNYKERGRVALKRQPQYLLRKRGCFVRMTVTLPAAVVIALRERSFTCGSSMSRHVETALRKYLGVPGPREASTND